MIHLILFAIFVSLDEDENEILDISSIRNLSNSYLQGILSFPFSFQERRNMEYFDFEEPLPEIDSEIFSNVFPTKFRDNLKIILIYSLQQKITILMW